MKTNNGSIVSAETEKMMKEFQLKLEKRKASLESKFAVGPFETNYVAEEGSMGVVYRARLNATIEALKYLGGVFHLVGISPIGNDTVYEEEYLNAIAGKVKDVDFYTKAAVKTYLNGFLNDMVNTESFITRLWFSTKQVAYICWYSVRIAANCFKAGLVWLWDKTIGRFFSKKEKTDVAVEATVESSEAVVTPIAALVAPTAVEATVEPSEAQETAVVETIVEEVSAVSEIEAQLEVIPFESVEEVIAEIETSIEALCEEVAQDSSDTLSASECVDEDPTTPFAWNGVTDDEHSSRARIAAQYAPSAIKQGQSIDSFAQQHGITFRVAEGIIIYYSNLEDDEVEAEVVSEAETVVDVTPNTVPQGTPLVEALNSLGSINPKVTGGKATGSSYNKSKKKGNAKGQTKKGKA